MASVFVFPLVRTGSLMFLLEPSAGWVISSAGTEVSSGNEALRRFFTRGLGTGRFEESSVACLGNSEKQTMMQHLFSLTHLLDTSYYQFTYIFQLR